MMLRKLQEQSVLLKPRELIRCDSKEFPTNVWRKKLVVDTISSLMEV